jgi:hypothetical protein
MSFILANDITLVGIFSQNGFRSVKPGATVKLAFANEPGHTYRSTIGPIAQGVGQGQIAVSGILARAESIGTSTDYPALINVSADMDRNMLRLGMVGTATVIADDAGPIGILANILLWVTAYALYLWPEHVTPRGGVGSESRDRSAMSGMMFVPGYLTPAVRLVWLIRLSFHELDQPAIWPRYAQVRVPKVARFGLRGEFFELSRPLQEFIDLCHRYEENFGFVPDLEFIPRLISSRSAAARLGMRWAKRNSSIAVISFWERAIWMRIVRPGWSFWVLMRCLRLVAKPASDMTD